MANDSNSLNIPEPTTIIEYRVTKKFPFVSIVDEAFALKPFRLQPLPRKNDHNLEKLIFRLSRPIQVFENSFGILASRFRIFRRVIIDKTGNIKNITKAAVILCNFLTCKSASNMHCLPDYVDQETP